jgi:predicted SnoaL-like aldol condensation-catalyzing enzyme
MSKSNLGRMEKMSQIETNKAIIQRYFDAYNNKNETISDEIISPDYIDHGQTVYMGSPGRGIDGAKNDLRYSLDRLDDLNYVVEDLIASPAYPDLVGTHWKGTLTPKATTNNQQAEKIINYRGVSIYRFQNNKMVETWHVIDGMPPGGF